MSIIGTRPPLISETNLSKSRKSSIAWQALEQIQMIWLLLQWNFILE